VNGKSRSLASTVAENAAAIALTAVSLAVMWPRFRPPAFWAKSIWTLAVLLPAAVIAFGWRRQRPAARLAGWTILVLEALLVACA